MKFAIVVGSIRENRVSLRQAKWTQRVAQQVASQHQWELVDLKDYNLPMFDEPFSPMAKHRPKLSDSVTKYLQKMGEADGFIMVTPEYNHGTSSALKNAIDLLDFQLVKKPVAIVSHGVVGGARANEQVRLIINSNLGGIPVPASHTFFGKVEDLISEDGEITAGQDVNEQALRGVIDSLVWHAEALKAAREK